MWPGGVFIGEIKVDKPPKITDRELKNIQAEQLLCDLLGKEEVTFDDWLKIITTAPFHSYTLVPLAIATKVAEGYADIDKIIKDYGRVDIGPIHCQMIQKLAPKIKKYIKHISERRFKE